MSKHAKGGFLLYYNLALMLHVGLGEMLGSSCTDVKLFSMFPDRKKETQANGSTVFSWNETLFQHFFQVKHSSEVRQRQGTGFQFCPQNLTIVAGKSLGTPG